MPSPTRCPATRRTLFVAPLLVLAAAASASAQVNVEALRPDDPPPGRSGSFGADVAIRTGNVHYVALDANLRLYDVSDRVTRMLVGHGGLGFLDRSRFASSGLLHLRFTYGEVLGVRPEWYGQLNYERPQLLELRGLIGGGGRIDLSEGPWGRVGIGSSLTFEHERLDLPDTALHPETTTTLRWTNFLTLRLVPNENLVITSTTYLQPEFRNFADVRSLENLRIRTAFTEDLALVVSFDLRFDSRPPDGIARLDTSLRTGVTFTY